MYSYSKGSAYAQSFGYLGQHSPVVHEYCGVQEGHVNVLVGNASSSTTGSGSHIGSPSSPLSCCTSSHPPNYSTATMIQRSLSNHSFHNYGMHPATSLSDLDIATGGNIQRRQQQQQRGGSPLANESASIILEGMTKAYPYSPEEKRERIERYRNKRTQRNFNKKIQYACRKTLADSRPRIRGRFARNDEIEKINYYSDLQWNQIVGEEDHDDDDDERWIHLLDSISSNLDPYKDSFLASTPPS